MQVPEAALTKIALFLLGEQTQAKNRKQSQQTTWELCTADFSKYIVSVYLRQTPPLYQILLCSIPKMPLSFQPDQTTALQILVPLETKEPHRDNNEVGFFNQIIFCSLGKDFHSRAFPKKGEMITLPFDNATTLNGRKQIRYFKGLCSPKSYNKKLGLKKVQAI